MPRTKGRKVKKGSSGGKGTKKKRVLQPCNGQNGGRESLSPEAGLENDDGEDRIQNSEDLSSLVERMNPWNMHPSLIDAEVIIELASRDLPSAIATTTDRMVDASKAIRERLNVGVLDFPDELVDFLNELLDGSRAKALLVQISKAVDELEGLEGLCDEMEDSAGVVSLDSPRKLNSELIKQLAGVVMKYGSMLSAADSLGRVINYDLQVAKNEYSEATERYPDLSSLRNRLRELVEGESPEGSDSAVVFLDWFLALDAWRKLDPLRFRLGKPVVDQSSKKLEHSKALEIMLLTCWKVKLQERFLVHLVEPHDRLKSAKEKLADFLEDVCRPAIEWYADVHCRALDGVENDELVVPDDPENSEDASPPGDFSTRLLGLKEFPCKKPADEVMSNAATNLYKSVDLLPSFVEFIGEAKALLDRLGDDQRADEYLLTFEKLFTELSDMRKKLLAYISEWEKNRHCADVTNRLWKELRTLPAFHIIMMGVATREEHPAGHERKLCVDSVVDEVLALQEISAAQQGSGQILDLVAELFLTSIGIW